MLSHVGKTTVLTCGLHGKETDTICQHQLVAVNSENIFQCHTGSGGSFLLKQYTLLIRNRYLFITNNVGLHMHDQGIICTFVVKPEVAAQVRFRQLTPGIGCKTRYASKTA